MLSLPWLALVFFLPLVGALVTGRTHDPLLAARRSQITLALSFVAAALVFARFEGENQLPLRLGTHFQVDALSAPLLPLLGILHLLVALGTARAKLRRFSFVWLLLSQTLTAATLTCQTPGLLLVLLALDIVLPALDMVGRGNRVRPYVLYQLVFVLLLGLGWVLLPSSRALGLGLLLAGLLLRAGIWPLHGWFVELFEGASLGVALPLVLSFGGILAVIRLVLPSAPESLLSVASGVTLVTAVYGGALALVTREPQRFFAYLCQSQSALLLAGVLQGSVNGLTAGLCLWFSAPLALAGLGLILRSLGARFGSLLLSEYHGLYAHAPGLALCFLFTGLASVGFPGTIGFVPLELLVSSNLDRSLLPAVALVLASMLNGLAVLRVYFQLFTGKRLAPSVPLPLTAQERLAIVLLALAIFGGGLFPQPGVLSRHQAADQLLAKRVP